MAGKYGQGLWSGNMAGKYGQELCLGNMLDKRVDLGTTDILWLGSLQKEIKNMSFLTKVLTVMGQTLLMYIFCLDFCSVYHLIKKVSGAKNMLTQKQDTKNEFNMKRIFFLKSPILFWD